MKRHRYTDEEKFELVKRILAGEKAVSVGRNRNIHPNLLLRWVKEYRDNQRFGQRAKAKWEPEKLQDALLEIKHLSRKLQERELEISLLRDILKKKSH